MVSDTRSGRKIRNEVDDNSLKNKRNHGKDMANASLGKADILGVRRSGRETSKPGRTTPSPQSRQKPKHLEKKTLPSTSPVNRKSERLEKHNTPSPLRRSDRGKKDLPLSSFGSQSAKKLSFSEEKRKKEKNLIQVTMEAREASVERESVCGKRKTLTGRSFKAQFKKPRVQENVSDRKLQGPNKQSVDATPMDNVVDEPPDDDILKDSQTSPGFKENLNEHDTLPTNCSPKKNMDSPESENSTSLARSQDGPVRSDSGEKCRHPGAPETIPSIECKNYSRPESSNIRINSDSLEKESCSLGANVDEDSSTCKDKGDHGAAVTLESAENCECRNKEPHSDNQMDEHENVCANCNNNEELKRDEGKISKSLSRLIAEGSTSRFLEYWIPVQISNHQLEQYCAALLSNSILLRSKRDPVGALRDILLTVKKCCDHPYLEDLSVQDRMIVEGCNAAMVLDFGIKTSGKLQLLDMMLTEFKNRGLKVLILFQLVRGSGKTSNGDIIDDFLRQRFGHESYERVDGGLLPPKRQAAVNQFNKNETGQFVFLLENRACSPAIKLQSVDVVVIYNSEWNPVNDLKALQKISIDSKVEQIKVFRLYSSCTIEERALFLAKQNINIDNFLQTLSRATCDSLLMWGASHLFSRLDDYHVDMTSASNISSGQLYLTEVMKELRSILSESCEKSDSAPVISKVKLDGGRYSVNIPLLGEAKVRLKEGEDPSVFWGNLLDRKIPEWKHLRKPSPRNRKRVQYSEGSPSKPDTGNDDVGKKRRSGVNENMDPVSVQVELGGHRMTQVVGPEGGPSTTIACNESQALQLDSIASRNGPNRMSDHKSLVAEVASESEERLALSNEQKSLHTFLQGELTKLCHILKLPEDVTHTMRRFLLYAIENHRVSSDSPEIVQAFQISLCWIAASITKQKVDKKDSLLLAKQLLDYQCTEEQALSVYSKMQSLKRMYLQCSGNTIESGLLAEENISREPSNVHEVGSNLASFKTQNVKMEIEEHSANEEHAGGQIPLQQKAALKDKGGGSEIDSKIKQIHKMCVKRMKKLIQRQQEKIKEFQKIWEEKRLKLEKNHQIESAIIRSLHGQGSARMEKLKLSDDDYAKKMEEHNLLKNMELKYLEAEQLAARDEEKRKSSHWLAEAKACSTELRAVNGPRLLDSQSEDDAGCSQFATHISIDNTDVVSLSSQHIGDQNPIKSGSALGIDVSPSKASVTPADAVGCNDPIESPIKLVTVYCQNEVGVTSSQSSLLSVVEQLNQSKQSSDNGEIVCAKLPASEERVCNETLPVELNKEVPTGVPENVPLGNISNVHPKEFSNLSSNKGNTDGVTFTNTMVSERGGLDESNTVTDTVVSERGRLYESNTGGVLLTGLVLEHSEQTVTSPDQFGLLQLQVPQDRAHQTSAELLDPNTLVDENQQDKARQTSAELLDPNTVVDENQCTSRIEVAASEPVDTVAALESNSKLQDEDAPPLENQRTLQTANSELMDTVNPVQSVMEQQDQDAPAMQIRSTIPSEQDQDAQAMQIESTMPSEVATSELVDTGIPVQSNIEAPAHENSDQIVCGSIEVASSCNLSPAVEVEHPNSVQGRSSLLAAEAVLSHQPVITVENLDTMSNRVDSTSLSSVNVAHEQSAESPVSSQSNVAIFQDVLSAAALPNQAVLQPRNDANHLQGSSFLVHPNRQNHFSSRNSTPPLFAEPLKSELDRICKEKEQLEKSHEDTASRLKSDCEKEIQEMVAQIRSKYEVKLQDNEAEHKLKKNELEKNQNKVLMNKILAEVFRSKSLDHRPTGLPGMQQGIPSSYVQQHLHQLSISSMQPSVRPSMGSSSYQVSRPQQTASPTIQAQTMQQQASLSHYTRPSPVTVQNVTPPPVQTVYNPAALFSGTPYSRPPVIIISAITPARNPSIGVGIRARAPHLQPFRPPSPASPVAPPHLQPLRSSSAASSVPPNPPVSARELRRSMDDWRHGVRNRASALPDISSTFGSLEPGDMERLGSNVQGNRMTSSSSVGNDVVCLSDDDD
ncbi:hypothetical protein ACJIZ3_017275 [Penstemon smallii]|uniref:Helicase C-terminal domain-containing protein n=1 Tax=Penstemon smallii TaxID=265156 RepID=A0ABD3SVG9_9LAMI